MKRAVILAVLLAFGAIAPLTPAADSKKSEKSEKKTEVKPVVAVFRIKGSIVEQPADQLLLFSGSDTVSLKELVTRLNKARDDENLKAVVLALDGATISLTQAEELRRVLAEVREKGKQVYACADELSMSDYVLLSGANRLSMVPTADLWLTGIHTESPYVRGLLDKIGVKPDFLSCGEYKSAAEIFMRDAPSAQAEEMQNWLLDSLYETQLELIAAGRGVKAEQVREWIDGGPYTAEKAAELGIIDAVEHRQDLEALVKREHGEELKFDHRYGEKSQQEIDLSSPFGVLNFYAELLGGGKKKKSEKAAVAVVYVEGPIVLGTAEANPFQGAGGTAASTSIRKALAKAAEDDSIKAVVLRVNSPGGSAVASEIILDATRRVKDKKPLVVSMGDVAGSGGYYVACGAETIFANDSTITGSIGVVGGKMATTGMWDKLGIKWKSYDRGANASLLSTADEFTPEQRERMQAWMDEIYDVFKGHVVAGRGERLKKEIDELAGGRVFTGRQALELGLVDKIGSLDDAVEFAAQEAELEDYEVRIVPEPKNFLELLMESSQKGGDDERLSLAGGERGSLLEALLPYLKRLDPQRLAAVSLAIRRLELIDREGAVLMMPEIVVAP